MSSAGRRRFVLVNKQSEYWDDARQAWTADREAATKYPTFATAKATRSAPPLSALVVVNVYEMKL